MGTDRWELRNRPDTANLGCLSIAVVAFLAMPYLNVWLATLVFASAVVLLLLLVFVRLIA